MTTTRNGGEIRRGPNGQVHDVRARGYDIHHGPGGVRSFRAERPGHVVVYSRGGGRYGYVQRPYRYGGVDYYHRTYYVNGVAYGRFYRPYAWGGVPMNVYVPGLYYAPGFYGWAYAPWGAPIAYNWGFAGNPWYGYYGGWFTPYPVYATPSLWLTDYLVAQTLQQAYLAQANAAPPGQSNFAATPMTPDVKQLISEEVHRQIALENAEGQAGPQTPPDPGSSGVARMFQDNTAHVFVVGTGLQVMSNGQECPVTEGDVLQLQGAPSANASEANAMVLASKGQDCPKGSVVTVGVADLQDMQNHMRETIDAGLGELQAKQGQNGIPPAPASAMLPPVKPTFAALAPPPDPNDANEVSRVAQEGAKVDQETLSQGGPSDATPTPDPGSQAPAAPPATVSLGMTIDEVKAIQGPPKTIVDLGDTKKYVYPQFKITFKGGKVTAID